MALTLNIGKCSLLGNYRENNEDSIEVRAFPDLTVGIVADGMGGQAAGEIASKRAVEIIPRELKKYVTNVVGNDETKSIVRRSVVQANEEIMAMAALDRELKNMGTTVVVALWRKGSALMYLAGMGDSRAYLYENGELAAVTEDQTWVNEVGRRLGLDESTLKNHPMRHVLTMAIGVADALRVHTYRIPSKHGMQILLCSDGLHGVATEEEIEQTLASEASLQAKCERLIKSARARGGPDNITAVLMKMA